MTEENTTQDRQAPDSTGLEKTLKKISAENERLREIAARYDELKKQQVDSEGQLQLTLEVTKKEAAERAAAAEAQAATASSELESARAYLTGQIEEALTGIPDESQRNEWKAALDGLDPIRQHKLLRALQATAARAVVVGGAAGLKRSPEVTRSQLAGRGPAAEKARLQATIAALANRGG